MSIVKEKVFQVFEMEYFQRNIGCYVDDFFDMKIVYFFDDFLCVDRIDFMKLVMVYDIKF